MWPGSQRSDPVRVETPDPVFAWALQLAMGGNEFLTLTDSLVAGLAATGQQFLSSSRMRLNQWTAIGDNTGIDMDM